MSLYDAGSNESSIKFIAAAGNRPMWLTIALALAFIYSLAALTQLVFKHQQSKADHARQIAELREINEPLRNRYRELYREGDLTAQFDTSLADLEALLKEAESRFPMKVVVHGALVVVSFIYLLKSTTVMGLAATAIWVASLLSVCSYIFKMDIAAAEYFLIVPNLGIGKIGHAGAVAQVLFPIGIFLFGLIKYRQVQKNRDTS